MNESDIDNKLEKIIKSTFGVSHVNLNSGMCDIPQWDSLKHIQLIMAIEEEFNIEIDFTDSIEMISIPILKSKILRYLNDK